MRNRSSPPKTPVRRKSENGASYNPRSRVEFMTVRGIIYSPLNISADEDPETAAVANLTAELQQSTLEVLGEDWIFGNQNGQQLLEEKDNIETRLKKLETTAKTHTNQIETLIQKNRALEARVKHLSQCSDSYLIIRSRYLDHYKRDILGMQVAGSEAILAGNAKAHEADVYADAMLYETRKRFDLATFDRLYGLDYKRVVDYVYENYGEDFVKDGFFRVLNAHCNLMAKNKAFSHDLTIAFDEFLEMMAANWPIPPLREDTPSRLRSAYEKFWYWHSKLVQQKGSTNH